MKKKQIKAKLPGQIIDFELFIHANYRIELKIRRWPSNERRCRLFVADFRQYPLNIIMNSLIVGSKLVMFHIGMLQKQVKLL